MNAHDNTRSHDEADGLASFAARVAASGDPFAVVRGDQIARWPAGRGVPAGGYLKLLPDLSPDDARVMAGTIRTGEGDGASPAG